MNQKLVDNLRSSLSPHLVGQKSSKTTLAKDIICILAISQSIRSSKEVAKVLRVDKRNIKRAIG
jgi:transcription initiation factor TFIIIB Brf1 subunit/transcription initiation factor TFIIB